MKAFVKDYDGERIGWMDYEDGATVGEFAFLCEQTQLWTVKTVSTCRVLCISRDAYSKLARAHPADSHQVSHSPWQLSLSALSERRLDSHRLHDAFK